MFLIFFITVDAAFEYPVVSARPDTTRTRVIFSSTDHERQPRKIKGNFSEGLPLKMAFYSNTVGVYTFNET